MNDNLRAARGILTAIGISLAFWGALAVLALWSYECKAANVEIATGKTEFGNAGDNIWYDQTYPHQNNLHPWSWSIGASGDFNYWLGWRATAIDFGKVSNSAVWPEDSDYFARNNAPAKYAGEGAGHAYGVSIAPTLNVRPMPNMQLGIEAGVLLYHAYWSERVRLLDGGSWMAVDDGPGRHRNGWTPYAGVTATYSHLFFSYRKYRDVWAVDSVFGNAAKQYMAGLTWRW